MAWKNRAHAGATQWEAPKVNLCCGKTPIYSQGRRSWDCRDIGAAGESSVKRPRRGEGAQPRIVSESRAESGGITRGAQSPRAPRGGEAKGASPWRLQSMPGLGAAVQ